MRIVRNIDLQEEDFYRQSTINNKNYLFLERIPRTLARETRGRERKALSLHLLQPQVRLQQYKEQAREECPRDGLHLRRVWQTVPQELNARGSHEHPHGRETVQL